MKRKMIALFLIFTMLASLSPAVAADEMSATPTVEEILSEYHQKAFEAQTQGDTDTASTWSRQGGAKTLEQETVDTLTAAGYDAYNVTADNYEPLEAELKTDFTGMGLDPEGSYIVVIHGEDPGEATPTSGQSTFSLSPIPEEVQLPSDGDGSTYFEYTHDGTTYYMRYVTVTAVDNAQFGMTSEVDLLAEIGPDEVWDSLSLPMSIISYIPIIGSAGVIYSFFSEILPELENTQAASLDYRGGTTWTVTYLEVYNPDRTTWRARSSVECVTLRYFIDYTYVDPSTQQYEQKSTDGTHGKLYSEHYGDWDWMKTNAVLAYEYSDTMCIQDVVEEVEYVYKGKVVITHQRFSEYIEERQ